MPLSCSAESNFCFTRLLLYTLIFMVECPRTKAEEFRWRRIISYSNPQTVYDGSCEGDEEGEEGLATNSRCIGGCGAGTGEATGVCCRLCGAHVQTAVYLAARTRSIILYDMSLTLLSKCPNLRYPSPMVVRMLLYYIRSTMNDAVVRR